MELNVPAVFTAIDAMPDPVICLDKHLRIRRFNSRASQLFGYSPQEAQGKHLDDLLQLSSASGCQDEPDQAMWLREMLCAGEERRETLCARKDGTVFPVELAASQVTTGEGVYTLVTLRDISRRKDAEAVLRQSETRYRGLIESQADLIVRVDPEGRFTFVNQVYCDLFGVCQEDLLGKSFTPLVHPDDLAHTLEEMKKLYQPPYRMVLEQRALTVNGWRWLAWEDSSILDSAGRMVEIQAIGRDITESKYNKQLIIRQRDLAQQLAETSSIHEAMALSLEHIRSASEMEFGGVYLNDPGSCCLRQVHTSGLPDTFGLTELSYRLDSPFWQAVMQGRTFCTSFQGLQSGTEDERMQLEAVQKIGMGGFLLIPIFHQGALFASFILAGRGEDYLLEHHRIAAETLALQVSGTISRFIAEEKLAESREELEILFNTIEDFVIAFDQHGRTLKVNQQVLDRLGYSEAELIGREPTLLHPPELIPQAEQIFARVLQGLERTCRLDVICKDGTRIPVETRVSGAQVKDQPVWIAISRDLTDVIRGDSEHKQMTERLALALEGSRAGLWDWKAQTGELEISERWAEIIGYSADELRPISIQTWEDLCHPEDLAQSKALINAHFAGDLPFYECEIRMRHKDGHWVWILDRGRVTERDDQGKPVRMTGTHLDITERHEIEDKLRYRLELEDLLGQLSTRFINLSTSDIDQEINLSLAKIGAFEQVDRSYIFLFTHDRTIMSNTHEWCSQGIEPQIEMLQDLPASMFPWWIAKLERHETIVILRVADLPDEAKAEREILQAQDILSLAVVPLYANNMLIGYAGFDSVGAYKVWQEDSIILLQRYGDQLAGLLERKRVENALRRSEERNTAILTAIPDNMFRINSQGMILDFIASDPASLLLPPEQMRNSAIQNVLDEDQARAMLDKIQDALQTGSIQAIEYHALLHGKTEFFEARFVASDEDEVIAIVRNVSERARLEQMKSDFINRATHDLRTPMTTILLMVRLLDDECTPDERQEYWSILKEELDRERVLIENLLTVSKLENQQYFIRPEPVDPFESLRNSIKTVTPPAAHKRVDIQYNAPAEGFIVYAEANALEEIFTNLIFNAIKFTPPKGRVEVSAHREGDRGCFRICDSGIGIAAEDLPNLFTRFFRGRNAIEYEIPGSGIGLYIVKSMIENFGGQIQIESTLGQGTVIEFWLPVVDYGG